MRFTPWISLTNVGIDDNVFNESGDPKLDRTAAIGPAVSLWMNLGRSRLTGKASGQYLYFDKYENQRAWNTSDEAQLEFNLGHLRPFVGGAYANTKDRPGYEIDSRARLRSETAILGSEVRISSRTSVLLKGSRARFAFNEGESFLGADLSTLLNRTEQSELLQFRFKLTALTTFALGAETRQDRFRFDTTRNSNSVSVLPGFEFKPLALISGRVFVGFKRFDALDAIVPDYSGPVAAVDATYITGPTQVVVKVNRDLTYSYETVQPYYALTDRTLVVTQRITPSWDLVGRGAWQSLDYRQLLSIQNLSERTDTIRQYGGGVGYRVGQTMRVGFDAVYFRRTSTQIALRGYKGLRYGASVTYGLQQ